LRERGVAFGQNLAHQHFKRWQRERPAPGAPAVELSTGFVRAVQQEISQAVAARAETLQRRLETSEAEARRGGEAVRAQSVLAGLRPWVVPFRNIRDYYL